MNIINYIYDKGKKICNRSSNIISNTNHSSIENEKLISKFSDISQLHKKHSSNCSITKYRMSSLSPQFLKLNGKILKKKKKKYTNGKKGVFINPYADKTVRSDLSDLHELEDTSLVPGKCLERFSGNTNGFLHKTPCVNIQHHGDEDPYIYEGRWKSKNNKEKRRQEDNEKEGKEEDKEKEDKQKRISNEKKKYWCTDPHFNEHILAEGGFKVDYIRHDRKTYQNRCDGVCALNDNIYIFDKIKKSIYLYTPYNNVWHIFLDIYEEVATKKKHMITNISDTEYEMKMEKNMHGADDFKYLNNISFTNYTDMVFLNNCIFVISSNSQFMNMCKVNINTMSTIFNTILVDCVNEQINSFDNILKSIKRNKQKKDSKDDVYLSKENAKRENAMEEGWDINTSTKMSNILKQSPPYMKTENYCIFDSENVNDLEEEKKEDKIFDVSESDECSEYTKGTFEIGNYLKKKEKEDKRSTNLEKKGKEKKVIKPRDLFSICSVDDSGYSLIYLFGGKGNSVKHKNKYVDNIYNDLYVYDFFKNKWYELYIYGNAEEGIVSNKTVTAEKAHADNRSKQKNTQNSQESKKKKKRSNNPIAAKYAASWSNEQKDIYEANKTNEIYQIDKTSGTEIRGQSHQMEQTEAAEQPMLPHQKSIAENSESAGSIFKSAETKEFTQFSDFEKNDFFNFNKKENESSGDYLKKIESDNMIPTVLEENTHFNQEVNLIKLSSNSSSSINKIRATSSGPYIDEFSSETNTEMVLESNKSFNDKNHALHGEKKRRRNFCITCANGRSDESEIKACQYICDLQRNNIRLRKMKWLHRRAGHSCVYYKNNLYFFGGISYYSFNRNEINLTFCNNLYLYNIASNKCFEILTKGETPEKRYRHSCVLINDYMFIIGGETQHSAVPQTDIFYYNFSTSVWTEINLKSQINFHSLYKTVWLENFGSIYMFGSSIIRLTKKDFQYTPTYKSKKKENAILKT